MPQPRWPDPPEPRTPSRLRVHLILHRGQLAEYVPIAGGPLDPLTTLTTTTYVSEDLMRRWRRAMVEASTLGQDILRALPIEVQAELKAKAVRDQRRGGA